MFFDSFENTVYVVLSYKTGMNVILVVLLHIRQKLLPKVHRVCVSRFPRQFVMEQLCCKSDDSSCMYTALS